MSLKHTKTYRISGTGTPVLSATIAIVPASEEAIREEAYTEGFIDGVNATLPKVDGIKNDNGNNEEDND